MTATSQHYQRQLQRGREVIAARQEAERAQGSTRREALMKTRRTAMGDRVTRFPGTEALLSELEELREELTDLYDSAAAMKNRDDHMAAQAKPDTARFSVLKEG